jgi:inosose dehydratase
VPSVALPSSARIGLNPLPWVLTAQGFDLTVPVLRSAFAEIATTGFAAIHADPPAGTTPGEYAALLDEFGLVPAPGYFSAAFHKASRPTLVRAAAQHAAFQAALGNTEVFIAGSRDPKRMAHPAVGAYYDGDALARFIDGLGAAAEAITAEGVRPALHPHVGSLVEVEHEVRLVLDAIPESVLGFGPDTGHLAWAGMDPASIMGAYARRIAGTHLKDVHLDRVAHAREQQLDYHTATRGGPALWTELGRGDINLTAALGVLPDTFAGWVIVEADVPEAPSNLRSTQISAQWITTHVGRAALTANLAARTAETAAAPGSTPGQDKR